MRTVLRILLAAMLVVVGVSVAPPAMAQAGQAGSGSGFFPTEPRRVLDTRQGVGAPVGAVPGGATITLSLGSLPAEATAVVLNLTGTEPTQPTFVTVYPAGTPRPTASNLNLSAGETRPNLVTVALHGTRAVVLYNHSGSVHLVADLAGYYVAGEGANYATTAPARVLDTRSAGGAVPGGGETVVSFQGRVPADATAVVFNLTGTEPTASTFVTAWPTGVSRIVASNINLVPGQTSPNLATVALGVDQKVSLYNHAGSVHLIADLVGYYGKSADMVFTPVAPVRALDTRDTNAAVAAGSTVTADVAAVLPAGAGKADAVVLNLTGTEPTQPTFVTAWAGGPRPATSNLNLVAGQTSANLAAVAIESGKVVLYNHSGAVHLIADVAGYFSRACGGGGCVYSWGDNGFHQLGTGGGPSATRSTPTPVPWLPGIIGVSAGRKEVAAVRGDGAVFLWGVGGAVPNGMSETPIAMPQLSSGVEQVSVTGDNALALKSDGTVWAWGDTADGQLGDGVDRPAGHYKEPLRVAGLTNIRAVAMGDKTGYALSGDGSVWAWGRNDGGALGNGTVCDTQTGADCVAKTPVKATIDGVIAISEDGFALRADQTVWTWGSNASGLLGDGSSHTQPRALPAQVPGLSDVVRIDGSAANRYAMRGDGTVWAWGANVEGQLGNDTTGAPVGTPKQVSVITDAVAIGSGEGGNGYAVRADGSLWGWGANAKGQLGPDVSDSRSAVPVRVSGISGVTAIAGYTHGAIALVEQPK